MPSLKISYVLCGLERLDETESLFIAWFNPAMNRTIPESHRVAIRRSLYENSRFMDGSPISFLDDDENRRVAETKEAKRFRIESENAALESKQQAFLDKLDEFSSYTSRKDLLKMLGISDATLRTYVSALRQCAYGEFKYGSPSSAFSPDQVKTLQKFRELLLKGLLKSQVVDLFKKGKASEVKFSR